MLELDAEKRITAEQALAHPYLAQYADPTDEPVSLPYDQSFEDMDLPVDKWKGTGLSLSNDTLPMTDSHTTVVPFRARLSRSYKLCTSTVTWIVIDNRVRFIKLSR